MENKEKNKPNLYHRVMHKFNVFYNNNLKKNLRVRPDIFAHILVSIAIFFITLLFVTTNQWAIDNIIEPDNMIPAGFAFLVVMASAIIKEVWDYVSGTGQAQGSDLAAGVLTGVGLLGITLLINSWNDGGGIIFGFVAVFLLGIPFIWGAEDGKGSYFMNWIKGKNK